MHTCIVGAAIAMALVPATAGAQSLTLTESQALERLSPDSPRARVISSAEEIARADVLNVGRWPNPRLNVDRESVAGVSETLTTVLQPLPVTGRRSLERASATASADATAQRADDELRRARADLRLAFADLVAAQTRERELTRSRDRQQELARILAVREKSGDAAGFDRLRAEREVLDVEADRVLAAADTRRAQSRLASFFAEGTDPPTLVAEERVITARDLPPVEALVEQANRTRGQILALQKDLDAARLLLQAADRRRLPEPELIAGTKTSNVGGGDVGSIIALQAVLPLFDRGQPERALARARTSQASAQLDVLRITVRSEISAMRAAAIERRRAADQYRESTLKTIGEVERIAQVSYDAGERGILELLDAYRTSSAARLRQARLDAGAREAEIELEFISGWEIP
jgi:cobalt-zinc-cadmium efflux system outer membrane protein